MKLTQHSSSRGMMLAATLILASVASAQTTTTSQPASAAKREWQSTNATAGQDRIGSLDFKGTQYLLQLNTSRQGAGIEAVELSQYYVTVQDKQLASRLGSEEAYAQAVAAGDGKYQGHYIPMQAVNGANNHYCPLETRSVTVRMDDQGEPLTWRPNRAAWQPWPVEATASGPAQSVAYAWTLLRDATWDQPSLSSDPRPFLRVVKTFTVKPSDYTIYVNLRVENLSDRKIHVGIDTLGPTGMLPPPHERTPSRCFAIGKWQAKDDRIQSYRKYDDALATMPLDKPQYVGDVRETQPPQMSLWISQANKFFVSAMMLDGAVPPAELAVQFDHGRFYNLATEEQSGQRTYVTGLDLPDIELAPGATKTFPLQVFAGPKKRDLLNGEGPFGRQEYVKLGLIHTIDIQRQGCMCSFDWLTLAMMWLLEKLAIFSLGNYGVAIILLVLLVRLLLHPLTKKSQVSMSRMQKLGPEMEKLKTKYANDKDTLNREMMKLYREQGIAPMLGCLPMFLQMPIWIALWNALDNAVELRHAAFLPVWITDLSASDALVSFGHAITLPLLSGMMGPVYSLNLLPLLLTVAMVLQTKLTPSPTASANPDAARQQKIMMFMMPVMMLLIFYNAPSGLTLYVMASTFAGVVEQYVIRKHLREREALEAAGETFIDVPGKGSRQNRPKKPKGPMWFKHG